MKEDSIQADASAVASSEKVTRSVSEWRDDEIVAAVRSGTHALVPTGGSFEIGVMDLDMWEGFEGSIGLMVELSQEDCRFVSPQMFGGSLNFSNEPERTDVSLNQASLPDSKV